MIVILTKPPDYITLLRNWTLMNAENADVFSGDSPKKSASICVFQRPNPKCKVINQAAFKAKDKHKLQHISEVKSYSQDAKWIIIIHLAVQEGDLSELIRRALGS